MHLLVSEQYVYIDSIMHGATIKVITGELLTENFVFNLEVLRRVVPFYNQVLLPYLAI